jgi:hypothetical protein
MSIPAELRNARMMVNRGHGSATSRMRASLSAISTPLRFRRIWARYKW